MKKFVISLLLMGALLFPVIAQDGGATPQKEVVPGMALTDEENAQVLSILKELKAANDRLELAQSEVQRIQGVVREAQLALFIKYGLKQSDFIPQLSPANQEGTKFVFPPIAKKDEKK